MAQAVVKLTFPGHDGSPLAGLLELPAGEPLAYGLFSHCFTCSKDVVAAAWIARALAARGYAILRFDFTGLGASAGDFADTNFSSNVQDLVAAADYLRMHYQAPRLLIGHSLGGAAVLAAAHDIPESQALVTVAAPYDVQHVTRHFAGDLEQIKTQGQAHVSLAGRRFLIKKQFLDDLQTHSSAHIENLKKALLIFHSPRDEVVAIEEAEKIYRAARHPKSFIGLDTADHLLSDKNDADYVADSIGVWAKRYLNPIAVQTPDVSLEAGRVRVQERDHRYTCDVFTHAHHWLGDEPVEKGGADLGPSPYEHLLAALGCCTVMTLRMYAERKQLALANIHVELAHAHHRADVSDKTTDVIERTIVLYGDLSEEQGQKLLDIANKCPVHRSLSGVIHIDTKAQRSAQEPELLA